MEQRIGTIMIILDNEKANVEEVNRLISDHSSLVLGRQGIPLRGKGLNVISLVIEGTTDEIGSLTGSLGRKEGVKIKSMLA